MKNRIAFGLAALCAALVLAACSGACGVATSMTEGRVIFTAVAEPRRPCLRWFAVYSADIPVWVVKRAAGSRCLRKTDFPIAYGVAPQGFTTITPAASLMPGFYTVGGHSEYDAYSGGFELAADARSLESYSGGSERVQAALRELAGRQGAVGR